MRWRRQDDAAGDDDGALPWWARLIFALGVPSAIACFLVYQIAAMWTTQLSRMERKIDHHEEARGLDAARARAFAYATCLNSADDSAPDARSVELARCEVANERVLNQTAPASHAP